jgi:3-phytase/alkaline phosphatase D
MRLSLKPLALGLAALFAAPHALAATVAADTVRFATFNASLNRNASGELLADLMNPGGSGSTVAQAHNVAEIIQRVMPDVLLVNEFDLDIGGTPGASSTPMPLGYASEAARLFQDNYLSASHGNAVRGTTAGIEYAYRYTPNTNTGLASGLDLDNSGSVGGGNDAFGFGNYGGQYGFTIYSKYEITHVRSFQTFLWKDMPGNLLTNDPTANTLSDFYAPDEIDALRLSSKNHVDLTLNINGQEVHLLASHPTPPTFDGAEDRNGKRNADEIRFWSDYVSGNGDYIYDDQGGIGGLAAGAKFVIMGDLNADPVDGDSYQNAINQLLGNPLVNTTVTPASEGGVQAATDPHNNGSANQNQSGNPMFDTADFSDAAPGNLRVDYVLPSANMAIDGAGVFWPTDGDQTDLNNTGALFDLVGTYGNPGLYAGYPSSDHKLVWADIQVSPVPEPGAWLMMLGGLGLIGHLARRRKAA